MVLVEAAGGGKTGLGYSYADTATAWLVRDLLAGVVKGRDAMAVPGAWSAMVAAVRNLGRPGIASMAISAVDAALWDLKARLLDVPLVTLLGAVRDAAPVYGSGGFTSYSPERLRDAARRLGRAGIPRVKMKIGRHPADDLAPGARRPRGDRARCRAVRRRQRRLQPQAGAGHGRDDSPSLGVSWFEEPVSSDDLDGLRLLRDRAPAGMEIAAGEYGYDLFYFRRMLDAGAVDVLQADAHAMRRDHRLLRARRALRGASMPLSAHCAPSLHAHPAAPAGVPPPRVFPRPRPDRAHVLRRRPDAGRRRPAARPGPPGFGLEFKRRDAARYAV